MPAAVATVNASDGDGGAAGLETEGLGGFGAGAGTIGRARGLGVGAGGDDCWTVVAQELTERVRTDVPRALRQRGLTGEVVLAFSLSGDGVARRVRVEKSSGSSLLDEAAVALLTRPFGVGCAGEGRWPVRWRQRAATP